MEGVFSDRVSTAQSPPWATDFVVVGQSIAVAKGILPLRFSRLSRFGETFAKNHLTIDAPVNLMVYVLNARSCQIARNRESSLIKLNLDRAFLGRGDIAENQPEECPASPC